MPWLVAAIQRTFSTYATPLTQGAIGLEIVGPPSYYFRHIRGGVAAQRALTNVVRAHFTFRARPCGGRCQGHQR